MNATGLSTFQAAPFLYWIWTLTVPSGQNITENYTNMKNIFAMDPF